MRTIACTLLLVCLLAGCNRSSATWVAQNQELGEQDAKVSLGYHLQDNNGTGQITPIVKIIRDDSPVADAMVFVTLLDAEGNPIGGELPTLFGESDAASGQAYHTEAIDLGEKTPAKLRYRMVTPDGETIREIDIK